jgi:hypothetical protein
VLYAKAFRGNLVIFGFVGFTRRGDALGRYLRTEDVAHGGCDDGFLTGIRSRGGIDRDLVHCYTYSVTFKTTRSP